MQTSLWLFLALSSVFVAGHHFQETPQQSLNRYVDFLNQSVTEVASRFQQIRAYQANIGSYIPNKNFPIALSPSGLLEEYPSLAAYVARGEARPAHVKAMADHMAVFEQEAA